MNAKLLGPIVLGAFALIPAAHAFRSTSLESYTDPDFKGYVPKKILLVIVNAGLEARREIEGRLAEVLAEQKIVVVPQKQLFTPTRTWTAEAQTEVLRDEGVDSGLTITFGAASSTVIPVATQFFAYENQGAISGTSYSISGAGSKAECSAVLLNLEGNRTVWYADLLTKASGTAYVGEKRDAKAFVKAIAARLAEDGHLREAP